MLSESMHSLADLGNQVLLAIGLQQSRRRADKTRPYGYGFEQYVWAMISGVSDMALNLDPFKKFRPRSY
jgi:divalent metal cation (Fe/Co/Zn/Cd) transporter